MVGHASIVHGRAKTLIHYHNLNNHFIATLPSLRWFQKATISLN